MKKGIFILALLFFTNSGFAQLTPGQMDSLRYYERELIQMNRAYRDSLHKSSKYISLMENAKKLRAGTDGYNGFVIFMSASSADFGQFNSQNSLDNFSPLSEPMIGFGYGFSFKKKRSIFDWTLTAIGISKKAKRGGEYIKTSFSSFFNLDWGYDFIKSNRINLYPYIGIGLRSNELEYKASAGTNPNYTNVTDIIQNNKSFAENITQVCYQAGMGLEVVISDRSKTNGIILFMKGGTSRPFSEKSFDIEGIKYNPGFRYGELTGAFGFKFFGR